MTITKWLRVLVMAVSHSTKMIQHRRPASQPIGQKQLFGPMHLHFALKSGI
jgi:hypothetical protein